jgi:hypothetical protein
MTKKDYITIITALKTAEKRALEYYGNDKDDANDMLMGISFVSDALAYSFLLDNPRFDRTKWDKATKIQFADDNE